jgi:hypothetical protein
MGVLAVKISCRRFQEENINIVINISALSLEVPELPIIQSLSLQLSPLLLLSPLIPVLKT